MSTPEISSSSRYIFLRHGESTGNAEKRHQGQADFPLTEKGIKQIHDLARHWKTKGQRFDLVFSSPLSRAKETAEIITQSIQAEIRFDPIWMERNNGELAGLSHEKALQVLPPPDFIPLYQPIASTGESQWELFLRAGQAVNQLMKNPPGEYLVVSHGGFLNMVLYAAFGLTPQPNFQGPKFHFSNTGYTTLEYLSGNDNWILQSHNNTSHLKT